MAAIKKLPTPGGHVFCTDHDTFRTRTKTNVLTKYHDDWEKLVTSRVFTSWKMIPLVMFLQGSKIIFKLNHHIQETNILTKFQSLSKICASRLKNCPTPWRPCFLLIRTIFELVRDIYKINVLTKFNDD
ncbi:hypothetical protein DPMN_086271 [Dreissena polymorpha]|uniref:Uncharacterized protein n=1 Tax=Dreissena polymorpha TaxID=45954 RepID=A0A9D4QVT1_DREPO|nr:hypothetical protein DPMN_086271 [Dreissena polymorpha]